MTKTTENKTVPAAVDKTQQQAQLVLHSDDPIFGMLFDSAKFAQLQRVANMYSASGLVPDQFKNNPAACAVGLQLSMHLQVSPFMLFQKLYIVHGKPGVEAQFVIALANNRGVFTGPIEYDFRGEKMTPNWICTAKAQLRDSLKNVEMAISWQTVMDEGWLSKPGSKWKTMPEQMFRYRTATWLIRTYAPEVLMGMYSREEIEDMNAIEVGYTRVPSAGEEALKGKGDIKIGGEPEKTTPQGATSGTQDDATGSEGGAESTNTVDEANGGQAEGDSAKTLSEQFDAIVEESGYGATKKAATLNVVIMSAGGGKPRQEWGDSEYQTAINVIKESMKREKARKDAMESKKQEGAQ